jgi:hypothetical protein
MADDYDGDWVTCWQCGGDGELANCWEEYACVDPEGGCSECMQRCDVCCGKGGWDPDPPSTLMDEGAGS